jgi:hypothetical protein
MANSQILNTAYFNDFCVLATLCGLLPQQLVGTPKASCDLLVFYEVVMSELKFTSSGFLNSERLADASIRFGVILCVMSRVHIFQFCCCSLN